MYTIAIEAFLEYDEYTNIPRTRSKAAYKLLCNNCNHLPQRDDFLDRKNPCRARSPGS